MTDKNLETVKQEVAQVVSGVPTTINTQEEAHAGAALSIDLNKELRARKKWFDDFMAPTKTAKDEAAKAYRAQCDMRDTILFPLHDADKQLRRALIDFQQAEQARQRAEQDRQNKLYEQRMARAEAKGKPLDEVKLPVVLAHPQKTTKAGEGAFTVKTLKVLQVTDASQIPDLYWTKTLNRKLLEAALRAGNTVPGAILVDELSSSVRTA